MKEIYEIIQELRTNNSSNYKQEVLEKYKDNEKLKKFLVYVYNPRWNYFMTKLPDSELFRHFTNDLDEASFYNILGRLKNREITGNGAKSEFSQHLSICGADLWHLYELVIARDIKANVSTKTINKVFPNLIQETPYQRCSTLAKADLDKIFDSGFAYAQKKLDGIFSYIIKQDDKVKLLTRAGTEWESDTLTKRMEHFPNGSVLVGEALIKENGRELDRKTGNGWINSFVKRYDTLDSLQEKISQAKGKTLFKLEDKLKENIAEWYQTAERLHFEVWDILSIEEFEQGFSKRPYHQRLTELKYMVAKTNVMPYINFVDSVEVCNIEQAMEFANDLMSQGYEGAVLKHPEVLWENKTSRLMAKIKAELECDLLCIGVTEGKGKYKGKIGSLICQSSCGNLQVDVGSGLKEIDVNKDPDEFIGKIVSIKYNQRSESKSKSTYSLFLPSFVEIRYDKTVADILEEIE